MKLLQREIKDHYSPEEYVNVFEASRLTGFAVATLRSMVSRGGGPKHVKRGRSVRYLVSDIKQFNRLST